MFYLIRVTIFGICRLKRAKGDDYEEYIDYYNTKRYQKRLKCMTPMEYRNYPAGIQHKESTNHF
ncbi:IS3 family transposase [Thermosediminibacter oceani]|uniref:IS3 family transposase n=1 Tax=Thermosediminibacter oceani TaxID=291990 RepID=UPI000A045875